jgi:hypothetical protein
VFPQVTELRLSNCPDLSLQASVANRPEIRRQNSKGIDKNQKALLKPRLSEKDREVTKFFN